MHLTSGILVLSSSLAAAVSPVPSLLAIREEIYPQPKVISFRLSGNGCPQGSTVVSTAHIWDNFSFDLPKFQVAIGGSSSPVKKSVNCQAHLNVGSSSGWQFALKDVWSTGHLDLEGPGVTLTQYITQYYSQSPKDSVWLRHSHPPPLFFVFWWGFPPRWGVKHSKDVEQNPRTRVLTFDC